MINAWMRQRKGKKGAVPDDSKDVFVGKVDDEASMVGWRKMKNGITMDSGSEVDITPKSENPEFEIRPATGVRHGRQLAAANGTRMLPTSFSAT